MEKTLIVLYGKPGVGKLTIAKEMKLQTGFPILHNHLTSDLVYSIFSRGNPQGSLLKQRLRVEVLDTWGKYGDTSIILTQLYKKDQNEKYFTEMVDAVKNYGFKVIYIHLLCNEEENRKRIESADRKKFGKIVKWEEASRKMKKNNMDQNVPFENNFEFDTTKYSAKKSARLILQLINENFR